MTERKIIRGSVLTLQQRVIVEHVNGDGDIFIRDPETKGLVESDPAHILSVEPAPLPPLKVGDRVREIGKGWASDATIVALNDLDVVLDWGGETGFTVQRRAIVSNWERLP